MKNGRVLKPRTLKPENQIQMSPAETVKKEGILKTTVGQKGEERKANDLNKIRKMPRLKWQ